jgi:2-oxoglutarate ferredoxin oxidoreductase subunit alpha
MLITTSFTSYTAKKFVKDNPEFGLIIIKFLKPIDERLKEELLYKEEIIFIENNYSGQLEHYLVKELNLENLEVNELGGKLKISHLRKYDLLPFFVEDFALKNGLKVLQPEKLR